MSTVGALHEHGRAGIRNKFARLEPGKELYFFLLVQLEVRKALQWTFVTRKLPRR